MPSMRDPATDLDPGNYAYIAKTFVSSVEPLLRQESAAGIFWIVGRARYVVEHTVVPFLASRAFSSEMYYLV